MPAKDGFCPSLAAPHINKLPVLLLQHMQQFGIGRAQKFIESGIGLVGEIKNKLVHKQSFCVGQCAQLYVVSTQSGKPRRLFDSFGAPCFFP